MAPTQAKKNGRNYRYYVSRPLLLGHAATAQVGSVPRVPAAEIETLVSKSVLEPNLRGNQSCPLDDEYARSQIERIEIQRDQLVVLLKQEPASGPVLAGATSPIVIPWQKPASKKPRDILIPKSAPAKARPIKLERRAALVAAIARGRRWLDELVAGRAASVEEIAIRSKRSARHVSMTIPVTLPRQGRNRRSASSRDRSGAAARTSPWLGRSVRLPWTKPGIAA